MRVSNPFFFDEVMAKPLKIEEKLEQFWSLRNTDLQNLE
jgi:hypothetical protein